MTGPSWNWFVALRSEGYKLHSSETLVQLARNDQLERLQADEFVDFFLNTQSRIRRVNARLKAAR
jgi:hypothetical protein